ncbi:unnamed protein product [Pneumocystis jirovecii]|uniref:Transcriptional regulatory protein RXT2 N-terminal domain-containing protein n=1 Tax=Pneumocystis jirovecii TaxID=42068 RepID=L0PDE7_PNEJI|nr:unnamed protein product [Pneumocystis jirovecii]
MKDKETLEELIRFKEALARSENASDSSSSVGMYVGNRGRKLKRKARYAYRGKLGIPSDILTDSKTVYYGSKHRTVIQRKKRRTSLDDTDGEASTHSDDPYRDIHIDELLAPIVHPADLPRHRSYRMSLTQSCLTNLAIQILDVISEEREYNINISKLLFIFLGDDWSIHTAFRTNEKFDMEKNVSEMHSDPEMEPEQSLSLEEGKTALAFPTLFATNDDSQSTCQKQPLADTLLSVNKSFLEKLNQYMDLTENDISDLRKLLQSALDRSNEYIRCLMQVRNDIIRAKRLIKKVYEWCVEAAKKENES